MKNNAKTPSSQNMGATPGTAGIALNVENIAKVNQGLKIASVAQEGKCCVNQY